MSAVRERRTAPTNGAARLALVLCVASALSMAVEAATTTYVGNCDDIASLHRLLQLRDRPSLRFPPVLLQLACQGVQLLGGDECWHDVHGEGGQEFVEQRHDVRRPLRGVQRWRRMQRVGVLRGHEWLLPVQTRTMLLGGQRRQLVSQRAVSQQRWQRMHLQRLQHHVRRPHGIVCRGHRLRQQPGRSTWTAARASPARPIRRAPAGPRRRARAPMGTTPQSTRRQRSTRARRVRRARRRQARRSSATARRRPPACASRTAPENKYWDGDSCEDCPANSVGAGGTATTCTCAANYWAKKSGSTWSCELCSGGRTKDATSTVPGSGDSEIQNDVCNANVRREPVLGR